MPDQIGMWWLSCCRSGVRSSSPVAAAESPTQLAITNACKPVYSTRILSGPVEQSRVESLAVCQWVGRPGVQRWPEPAAACGTRSSRMHLLMTMPLAGSPIVAEAARCLGVACEPPDARLPSARGRIWRERFGAHSRSIVHTDTRPMPASTRMGDHSGCM
jgi:hypothetical protein